MVRVIGFLVGLGFVVVLGYSLIVGASAYLSDPPEETVEHEFHHHPKQVSFASDGPFGRFDRAQLQRGYRVYEEVCAVCHSLRYVAFRNLQALEFSEAEVDALAAQWQIPDINPETGEAEMREGIASDYFPSPYANDAAARAANNNAIPPDLSLIAKARHDGAAYVYSLLTGYEDPPAELPEANRPGPGLYYNPYFPNLNLAMMPPLTADGQVTYDDGTEATVEQMAKDVSAFLIWTAEPKLEARKSTGWAVLIFLAFATVLAFLAKRNVWRDQKH
ncbi:MAG: cytochrome c1 [Sphingomonadales bacterium]|nr:cytochrome c1 [Sphingomonadales bacterium]